MFLLTCVFTVSRFFGGWQLRMTVAPDCPHHTGPLLTPHPYNPNCTLHHACPTIHPPALPLPALLPTAQHRPLKVFTCDPAVLQDGTQQQHMVREGRGLQSSERRLPGGGALPLQHQFMQLCSVCAS